MLHVVCHVERQSGRRFAPAKPLHALCIVQQHPVLQVHDAFRRRQQLALLNIGVAERERIVCLHAALNRRAGDQRGGDDKQILPLPERLRRDNAAADSRCGRKPCPQRRGIALAHHAQQKLMLRFGELLDENGATTIWESWEGDKARGSGVASLDHYSKGAVTAWLFETMCGIRVEGENRFTVAPHPGGRFTRARAVYNSVYGKIESGWEKTADGWKVPAGAYTVSIGGLTAIAEKSGERLPVPAWQKGSWYERCTGKPDRKGWETMLGRAYTPPVLKKGSFTMENSVEEMKDYSLVMKIVYRAAERVIAKGNGGKIDREDPTFRMQMAASAGGPLRSMMISGGIRGGVMPGLLEMANGRFLRGIRKMITG